MTLNMQISIGFINVLICHILRLLKLTHFLIKQFSDFFYISLSIVFQFITLRLQWQARVEFCYVPLLI